MGRYTGRAAKAIAFGLVAALVLVGSPALLEPAHATYSGVNGPIAYYGSGGIRTIDGTNDRLVVNDTFAFGPDWSPDGRRIAYSAGGAGGKTDIFTVKFDGTDVRNVTNSAGRSESDPNWSPDGGQFVFTDGSTTIASVNTDGSSYAVLRTGTTFVAKPVWDPSGNTIVYHERVGSATQLIAMNSDGTGRNQLTSAALSSFEPDYSPDGTQIVFARQHQFAGQRELWVMNANGSNQAALLASGSPLGTSGAPSWSPDGTQIAYEGEAVRSGSVVNAIYVIGSDGSDTTAELVVAGGINPDWGPTAAPDDPVISAQGTTINGTEGAALSNVTVATFTDADQGGQASDYTATINWGDTTSSAGTVSGSGGSYSVTGSHTYTKYGSYPISVQITDTNNNVPDSATANSTASIADAAITASGKGTIVSQAPFSGAVASFTDANPFGDASEFTASINWGDGSAATAGVVAANGAGGYDVSGSHQYATTGTFSVGVTINSAGGSTAAATTTILVYGTAARGGFVIGDGNAALGSAVTFWGSQWSQRNSLSGGPAPSSFKGFASSPAMLAACGQTWSTGGGNSPPPPAGPLPEYMAVIVTSAAAKMSQTISGTAAQVVVVRVNPGYAPDPRFPGTGTVVGRVC